MSSNQLLKGVKTNTTGAEVAMRVLGNREIPATINLQIQLEGTGKVQIQGRIARDAPWINIGAAHTESALVNLVPVPFLRAIASEMSATSVASVWCVWGW